VFEIDGQEHCGRTTGAEFVLEVVSIGEGGPEAVYGG